MKRLFALILSCSSLIPAFSQKNFVKALVVNQAGDTLRGLIDYRERSLTPTFFDFKMNENSASKRFSTRDIRTVEIEDGEIFQRFVVTITMDINDPTRIKPNDPILPPKTDTLLLEVIQRGTFNLYAYKDQIKTRFFLAHGNANPEELIYRVTPRPGSQFNKFHAFRNELANAAKRENKYDVKMNRLVQFADYKRDDILKIIALINGSDTKKDKSKVNPMASIYVGIGAMRTAQHFSGPTVFTQDPKSTFRILPNISIGADLYTKPSVGRLFFRVDLSSFLVNNDFQVQTYSVFRDYDYRYNFKVLGAKLGAAVMYHFYRSETIKLYAGAGFHVVHAFKEESEITETSYVHDTKTVEQIQKYPFDVETSWANVSISAGARFADGFDVAVTFLPKRTITTSINPTNDIQTLALTVNYTFAGKRKN